jgi:hypothetical protein
MSLPLLFLLLIAIAVYWTMTQILPERRRVQLLRPSLADGLLEGLNARRHERGLPILELDEDLLEVAESKATHQFLTGIDEEGWDYPASYAGMFGRSLLMEVLVSGPAPRMLEKLLRQTDVLDGEWVICGIGAAGGRSDQVVVAMVLCREAWEPATVELRQRSILERLALTK